MRYPFKRAIISVAKPRAYTCAAIRSSLSGSFSASLNAGSIIGRNGELSSANPDVMQLFSLPSTLRLDHSTT